MLNINSRAPQVNQGCPNISGGLIARFQKAETLRVAFRCERPLDAFELEQHGYKFGFYEHKNEVRHETFDALSALDIEVLVYFVGLSGTDVNLSELEALSSRYGLTLCRVLLPFCPYEMTLWSKAQWRVFDVRLSKALTALAIERTCLGVTRMAKHCETLH